MDTLGDEELKAVYGHELGHIVHRDLISDPYASPLKGRPVVLDGTVTGRADAGNKIGEDFTLLDVSGGLMMINYESPFGKLGNYWFALRRVGKLMNQRVRVLGWFRPQYIPTSRPEEFANGRRPTGHVLMLASGARPAVSS